MEGSEPVSIVIIIVVVVIIMITTTITTIIIIQTCHHLSRGLPNRTRAWTHLSGWLDLERHLPLERTQVCCDRPAQIYGHSTQAQLLIQWYTIDIDM